MNKINFGKIYNDFGETLPRNNDEFFNISRNEVTREMVQAKYKINSNYRSYAALVADYKVFVDSLKKQKQTKDTE